MVVCLGDSRLFTGKETCDQETEQENDIHDHSWVFGCFVKYGLTLREFYQSVQVNGKLMNITFLQSQQAVNYQRT